MQQIYKRTPIPNCDFNKVAKQLYWNHTSKSVFSYKFNAYSQKTISEERLRRAASEIFSPEVYRSNYIKKWFNYNYCDSLHFHFLSFILFQADTDVFKMSSGRLKKVTTSYDQTGRCYEVWKMTSDLRRLEDAWFTLSWRRPIYGFLKTSDLRRLEDVQFATSWKYLIYNVFRTSDLRRLEDVRFTLSWRRPIYDILKMSDLWRLEDVCKTTFVCQGRSDVYTTSKETGVSYFVLSEICQKF